MKYTWLSTYQCSNRCSPSWSFLCVWETLRNVRWLGMGRDCTSRDLACPTEVGTPVGTPGDGRAALSSIPLSSSPPPAHVHPPALRRRPPRPVPLGPVPRLGAWGAEAQQDFQRGAAH